MLQRVKPVLVWTWMSVLLLSTVGINLHRVFCYCTGLTSFVFFQKNAPSCRHFREAQAIAAAPCCTAHSKSCCSSDVFSPDIPEKDCTDTRTETLRMEAEFLVEKPDTLPVAPDFPLWVQEVPFLKILLRKSICAASFFSPLHPQPPPPSGRERCIRMQIFRC
jgi:hypothetical protein